MNYNRVTSVDFEARLWLWDATLHDVEVWVFELDPVGWDGRRSSSEWIRESIREVFYGDALYKEFDLKSRYPESDEHDGFQIVVKGNITGHYSMPYNEWDENISFDMDNAKIGTVTDSYFQERPWDQLGEFGYREWLSKNQELFI